MKLTKPLVAAGASVAVALAGAGVSAAGVPSATYDRPAAGKGGAGRVIAATTLGNLSVAVRVRRVKGYKASVTMNFERSGQQWSVNVPGSWLWEPLSGPNAVCRFGVNERPDKKPIVDLSLLVAPSTGCSKTLRYVITV